MNHMNHEDYVETPLAIPVRVYGGIEASIAGLPEAQPAVPLAHGRTHHQQPAAMRNLYAAAISYDGFIITDGALRLIVLLHATALGFNAIEIAFMFSMYEVAGVFTNLFGGVAGSKFGLKCTLISSLILQLGCLTALTQLENVVGKIEDAKPGSPTFVKAIVYITFWQALGGVAKDLMKLTGKATPKLVTREGAEGRLFKTVAWITGMKNALKGFGSYLGALLVAQFGWVNSLWILSAFLFQFFPLGLFGMDRSLGVSQSGEIDWKGVFRKGRNVNVLSAARFFLFGARDVWFEIGLPMFLQLELGWSFELVGFVLAVYIVIYGYLQAATTNLYKANDGTTARPTAKSAYEWAVYCSLTPVLTAM